VGIASGKGATLTGTDGETYIDFASGIGVNSVGYGNEAWVNAITEQAKTLCHISNLFYSEPCAKLAKRLCDRTGMSCVFFANGGGEANEGLIKMARKYSFDKYGQGRATVITLVNSFHGRTITTLKATGQEVFHQYFFPFTEGFRYAQANDIEALKAQAGDDVCAVMMELVQGEGGVMPLDKEYVQQVKALCDKNDWLLLIDEVQTGVGRTGSLFAFQQYDLLPDGCSFAKGIAGGLPMSGIMANEKCRAVLTPGTHATTFGGNPIAAAAALTVQDILNDDALKAVQEKGAYLRQQIESFDSPAVSGTRGLGLMIGITLNEGYVNKELANKMIEQGLLVLTAGQNVIRLLPPLTISQEEMDAGLAILKQVLCG
jgi:acetylornithine/N-succinyldiaminopimelate aminotransferase